MDTRPEQVWLIAVFSLSLLLVAGFFMCGVALRFFTRQVFVEPLGMSNAFTELVLFDTQNLAATKADDAQGDSDSAYTAVIPRFMDRLLRGEPCVINGDGR